MTEFVTTGYVEDGVLHLRNRKALHAALSTWKDGDVVVRIARRRAVRSLSQNAYYWAVVVHLLADHTGYTPDEIHDILKAKFLPKRLAVCDGNGVIVDELVIGGSTRQMNTIEFGDYIDRIRQWADEDLGVLIQLPNEDHWTEARTA